MLQLERTRQLAEQWSHGIDDARKRLIELIEVGHRFDARDRQALAYVLMSTPLASTANQMTSHDKSEVK